MRGGNGGVGGGLRLLDRSEPPPRRVTARALGPRGPRRGHREAIGALPLGVWHEGSQSDRLVGERPPIRSDLLCLNATESAIETAPNAPVVPLYCSSILACSSCSCIGAYLL